MVALHNRRLGDKELFRGVLWTDEQWHAMRDSFIEQLKAEGVEEPHLRFRASRMMEDYQRTQPSMRERQEIIKRIYPPKTAPATLSLDDEELAWLIERLEGVNDPTGLDILDKLQAIKARRT